MSTIQEYSYPSFVHTDNRSCPWRLVNNGFNIEGLCTNLRCIAFNQMVILNLGYGEFDFTRIILQRKNKCPICRNEIRPVKYALNRCRWWYVNHYSTRDFPLNTVNDTYELNDLNCEYIIMEVMPLLNKSRIYIKTQEITCPICLNNMESDYETARLGCSHTFHRICIDGWSQSNQSMSNTCPICRNQIIRTSTF